MRYCTADAHAVQCHTVQDAQRTLMCCGHHDDNRAAVLIGTVTTCKYDYSNTCTQSLYTMYWMIHWYHQAAVAGLKCCDQQPPQRLLQGLLVKVHNPHTSSTAAASYIHQHGITMCKKYLCFMYFHALEAHVCRMHQTSDMQ
jgi:hypothetical protein